MRFRTLPTRLLLALGCLIATAPAALAKMPGSGCGPERPFTRDEVDVPVLGRPGQTCRIHFRHAVAEGRWNEIRIVSPPTSGRATVSRGKTRAHDDALIVEYVPQSKTIRTDEFVVEQCRTSEPGSATAREGCARHVFHIRLSPEAAAEKAFVCRTRTPVAVDFATPARVAMTGPSGSPCFIHFPPGGRFWWRITAPPRFGTIRYDRARYFEYRPSSAVDGDTFAIDICADAAKTQCSRLDFTIGYTATGR